MASQQPTISKGDTGKQPIPAPGGGAPSEKLTPPGAVAPVRKPRKNGLDKLLRKHVQAVRAPSVPDFLRIERRRTDLDEIAERALEAVRSDTRFAGREAALLDLVREHGLATPLHKLKAHLERTGLDEATRQLLSTPGVYTYLLHTLLSRMEPAPSAEVPAEAGAAAGQGGYPR